MPRKPNYDFERRERERLKAAKLAERALAKAAAKLEADPLEPGEAPRDAADAPETGAVPSPARDEAPAGAGAAPASTKAEKSAKKATGIEARQKSRRDDETANRTAEAEKIARLRALRLQKEEADRAAAAAKAAAQPRSRKGG